MQKITVEQGLAGRLGIEPGEYDIHLLYKGVIALSPSAPSEQKKPEKTGSPLSPEELAVLTKLTSFRFESRIPYAVNKTLTEAERKTLEGLIKKNLVELYKGGKYSKTGVYNIPKSVYPLIRDSSAPKEQPKMDEKKEQAPPQKKLSGVEMLQKFGYAIVDNEGEAREVSSKFEKQIRAGDYMGVRAFNKKFYIAERGFYVSLSEKVRRILVKKDATVLQIASELKAPEDACTIVLTLMNNESEVIEKAKGFYRMV